ncbi:MAG: heavy metal translocating P-type ATPase [Lachnospiraceae bacterium]|nr:heavy metal translocating P-type ATPase [Lachnospiraceae bacterium]
MTKNMKKRMIRVSIGALLFFIAVVTEKIQLIKSENLILGIFLVSYFIIGGDVVKRAVRNIGTGQIFDENFLMTIATVGAFLVSEYPEAVAVMLFYQVGELFQDYAVHRSRKSIAELMDIRPDYANLIQNGEVVQKDPSDVEIGQIILVRPGERIPLDGVLTKGSTSLDTSALTGESLPRDVMMGSEVLSGCVNLTGAIEIRTTKEFGDSTVAKILELVENASSRKAQSEDFITKFARFYTPVVVISAALLAILPPLLTGADWKDWMYRALTFLVISCPCALVISVPLSFFGGLGGAGRSGILIKGGNYLEALSQAKTIVFDKTGTLTKGRFAVTKIVPHEIDPAQLLEVAAYAEYYSNHPIALSIREAYGKKIEESRIAEATEEAGYGVRILLDGKVILAGNSKMMSRENIGFQKEPGAKTVIHVAQNGVYAGHIQIEDEIREDAAEGIARLKKAGIRRMVMLTGDRHVQAMETAAKLGITEVYSQLLPGDKVDKMEEILKSEENKGKVIFVGDGMNDAPVLARADIGAAMGGIGSDAAIEAADLVIMNDSVSKLSTAIRISSKTIRIVKQNIVFAIGIKVFVLLLAAIGYASMWAAVFADVGVAVIAIINAMRAIGKVKD